MNMYHQLPTSPAAPENANEDEEKLSRDDCLKDKCSKWLNPRLCFILCVFCTLINVTLSLFARNNPTSSYSVSSMNIKRKDIHHLRRPSQFIRFDEIERLSPPEAKQFNNYPILLTQVDNANTKKVFPDDPKRITTHTGTISREDRRVLVTETISTIVQFRAMDWGMEICELHLLLPSPSSLSPSNPNPFSAESFPFSIYRLNATITLDVTSLSHSTRPARIAKVGEVQFPSKIGNSTSWHRKFSCMEEEVLSFELACSDVTVAAGEGEACRMEWWQNKDHPDPAIFVSQHSTK